ncbi:hypothetical protein CEXT_803371 [Caerostris extrusa]|uniref:Uncharacterized protein n=1 Tax=Caerostris extrusa TaxID=172846 RepID=A0AAV4QYU7_CAEEX|nr:hypothetical protein CEXT_803371 [Caerostris extrusa]
MIRARRHSAFEILRRHSGLETILPFEWQQLKGIRPESILAERSVTEINGLLMYQPRVVNFLKGLLKICSAEICNLSGVDGIRKNKWVLIQAHLSSRSICTCKQAFQHEMKRSSLTLFNLWIQWGDKLQRIDLFRSESD